MCKQRHLAVGVDGFAIFGDDAQTVAVAVKGQAQFGACGLQSRDDVFQVLRLAGVWMMVGEVAIHFAEQLNHFAAQGAEDARRCGTRNAVPAIDHHFHGAAQAHIAHDAGNVVGSHIHMLDAAASFEHPALGLHDLSQALNFVTINSAATEDHFETVVVLRVVAARDLNAALAQGAGCKVQHGRCHSAHINHLHTCSDQATHQRFN